MESSIDIKVKSKSGIESEYFPRHKVPSYFSKIDNDDEYDNDETSQQCGFGDQPRASSLLSLNKFKGGPAAGIGGVEADVAVGGHAGGTISRVTSFKSLLSVSHIGSTSSANLNNSVAPQTPGATSTRDPFRSPSMVSISDRYRSPSMVGISDRYRSPLKSPLATSSIRPHTTYITNDFNAIVTPSANSAATAFQSLDYNVLNDLNLGRVDLNFHGSGASDAAETTEVTPTWRLKERMKTVGVGLILALNIGTDPPDVSKPSPCAKLQCWMDPSSTSRAKAREQIGVLLEGQYARWQGQLRAKLKYKRALDPTVEEVRNLCNSLRRTAKNERVILHYNGHGVPKPTLNGEIWVFDKNHTQYIPFAVTDLKQLIGKPSLVVLDCNGAGALLPFLTSNDDEETHSNGSLKSVIVLCPTSESETLPTNPELPADLFTSCLTTPIAIALRWFVRQNPLSCAKIDPDSVDDIPGKLNDRKTPLGELNWIFTAITDTIAWNVLPTPLFQSLFRQDLMVASMFRNFLLADRILRELSCTPMSYPALPSTCNHPLWQAWDLAVETCLSQLTREGLLGNKRRPHTHTVGNEDEDGDDEDDSQGGDGEESKHHFQGRSVHGRGNSTYTAGKQKPLPGNDAEKTNSPNVCNISAPFFAEQLTAFQKWLEYAANRVKAGGVILSPPLKQYESFVGMQRMASFMYPGMSQNIESPEQLPVVLQVLLSPAHRVRALILLRKFLYLGPSAVNLALIVGISPYVLRLLQSPIDEYKHLLVGIWSKILEFDPGCKHDLVKEGALPHFIRHLHWGKHQDQERTPTASGTGGSDKEDEPSHQRTMAAVILSAICSDEPLGQNDSLFTLGQTECLRRKLHGTCASILKSIESDPFATSVPSDFRMWLCICLGVLCKDNITSQNEAFKTDIHLQLCARLQDDSSDVRAAACFALGCLISFGENPGFMGMMSNITDAGSQMLSPAKGQSSMLMFNNAQGNNLNSNLPWQQQQFVPLQAQPGARAPMMSPISDSSQMGLMPQLGSHNAGPFQPAPSSEFNDSLGLDRDLLIFNEILDVSDDASPIVRYEATVVLARLVRKYLTAFSAVAKSFKDRTDSKDEQVSMPIGLSAAIGDVFVTAWKKIRSMHESDPHPKVASANTAILRFVNERTLGDQRQSGLGHGIGSESNLADCEDDAISDTFMQQRTRSAVNFSTRMEFQKQGEMTPIRIPSLMSIAEHGKVPSPKMHRSSTTGAAAKQTESFLSTKDFSTDLDHSNLPMSQFYERQKEIFKEGAGWSSDEPALDPLCTDDAILLHREQRNLKIDRRTKILSEKFALLQPLPKKRKSVLDFDNDEPDESEMAMEAEIASKKKSLNLKEKTLISYDGTKMTHMLRFHAYESVLAASDGAKNVSVWDINNPKRKLKSISNGNDGNIKMTSMSWINERNHSLLLTGCDDGSLRIWDNVLDGRDGSEATEPVLATAFYALPELVPGQKYKSGMVTEWQQSEGRLVAGGNTSLIRCWDLESEKCKTVIDSKIQDTCATSFATAWDYIQNESTSGGFSGIGPDIIIGGYGDGRIKIFDLRMHDKQDSAATLKESPKILRRNRNRWHKEHLHKHWIVDLSYTHSPTKYEVSICLFLVCSQWNRCQLTPTIHLLSRLFLEQ